MKKTFIIAEASVNHNGNVEIAKKMINVAKTAGADAIKFQTFKAEKVVTQNAPKARYQIKNMGSDESQFEMLKRLELSESDHEKLFKCCSQRGIVFMSTPFDEESADFLNALGMRIFKIPSGEITNKPLIQHIASKRKPIVLSTGISYLKEIEKAILWVNESRKTMNTRPKLTLLHCVSNYPADAEDMNLLAIKTLESAFGLPVGLSDHTMGIETSIAAVAMGASVIEKHFTLSRHMRGPDHKASLEPKELEAMVRAIRNIEKAFGNGVKRPARNELDIRGICRRSLVAGRDIKRGEVIGLRDISIKRPGTGLPPEQIELVMNRMAATNIKRDTVFKKNHFVNA